MVTPLIAKAGFDPGALAAASSGAGPRRLVILGATGSIGQSTADVVAAVPGRFAVEAVVSGREPLRLAAMARRLGARLAVVADPAGYSRLKEALQGSGVKAAAGPQAVLEAAVQPADLVIGAIAGAAGVEPTFAAVREGRTIALANKECLVCAGAPFMQAVRRFGARILPMDSEHNAIFQALAGRTGADIDRMTLTASGGPFLRWSRQAIDAATPAQALIHPNWDMGPKVTVDSAGLMNKGLELIEAHFLFAIAPERLDVLVHPQSIVHGLISYADGSSVAGLANPDMRVPIAHCLGWPERLDTGAGRLDLARIGELTFETPDLARFPALGLAIDAMRNGDGMPTVLNAANEVAVEFFLSNRIAFGAIAPLVRQVCEEAARAGLTRTPASVADALSVDHISREMARTVLA